MKRFHLFITALFVIILAPGAFAEQANVFECKGLSAKREKIELSYSSSSVIGKPTLSLQIGKSQILPVTDGETYLLTHNDTANGLMVSASLSDPRLADAPTMLYSVIIPTVHLNEVGQSLEFSTVLLSGYTGGYRRAPLALQVLTQVDTIKCVAKAVKF